MNKLKLWTLLIITIILTSCGEGYEKIENEWAWVLRSEAGKHVTKLNADEETFEILSDEKYAKDKETVFWEGVPIEKANSVSFEVLSNGYSKDDKHVFLYNDIVIFANPEKFEILEWPYSKDDRFIFNGTVPLTSKNIDEFVVTRSTGSKTSSIKSFFIEGNKDFQWLDTIDVNGITISEDSEGQTKTEKFKGVRVTLKNLD